MSDFELPEHFELHGAVASPSELPSRAWMALKKLRERLDAERASLVDTTGRIGQTADNAARALGLLSHEISRSARRAGDAEELRHLSLKADDALRATGVRLEDPAGQPLVGALLERCHVLENLPRDDVREHIVGETLTPAVLLGPKIVHLAEVIGWIPQPKGDSDDTTA